LKKDPRQQRKKGRAEGDAAEGKKPFWSPVYERQEKKLSKVTFTGGEKKERKERKDRGPAENSVTVREKEKKRKTDGGFFAAGPDEKR